MKEFFREIRNNLEIKESSKELKTILVTSANNNEGKSFTSENLAIMYTKANKKVLLVDLDMENGKQHETFKVNNKMGLSNILLEKEEYDLKKYVKTTNIENLDLLTKGENIPNLEDYLLEKEIKKLVEIVKQDYDKVIFDGASKDIASEVGIISKYVDSTIIIARYGKTKTKELQQLKKKLVSIGGNVSGVVLNKF